MKKAFLIALVTIVVLILLGTIGSRLLINSESLSSYLENEADGHLQVEIGNVKLQPLRMGVQIDSLFISTETGQRLIESDHISLRGINPFSLFNRKLDVNKLQIDDFFISTSTLDSTLTQLSNSDDSSADNPGSGNKTRIFIGSFDLLNGQVEHYDKQGGVGVVSGLDVSGDSFNSRSDCQSCTLMDDIENIRLTIESLSYLFDNNRYLLSANSIELSETSQSLSILSANLIPALPENEFKATLDSRKEIFETALYGISINEIDTRQFRQNGSFLASVIQVDSLDLHVKLDKRLPERQSSDEKPIPPVLFNKIQVGISIDTVRLLDADIRYSETATNGRDPGTVLFENSEITIENFNSMDHHPVHLSLQTLVEGEGRLRSDWMMTMEDNEPIIEVTGSLGSLNMSQFNKVLENLEGIRITGGMIESLDFNFRMTSSTSNGEVDFLYNNLKLERVDNVTGESSLGNRITSFLLNGVVVRESSMNGNRDSNIGAIEQEKDPDGSFFNYLWISIRSGLMDVIRRI